jgi:hypothetical protein
MKKRLALIVVAAAGAASILGGMSAGSVQHDARCAALHAKAAEWQKAANNETDPVQKARDQKRADILATRAARCDAQGTTTSSSTP